MSLVRAIDAVFSRSGSLARAVEGHEWRPQQFEMARAVGGALDSSDLCLVEAPTGVGKSLAYLVPGAIWARKERKVVLVSTYTRNLQDQILRRDLPILRRVVDRSVDVAVLKGRANYLCRRRWDQARDDLAGTTDGEVLVRHLEGWVAMTEQGDFDEAPALPSRPRALLSRVGSDPRFCASPACAADEGCFFKLSRRRARDAHLVLVNHSLLVLDLIGGGAGLPPWDALIVDEAHHLPRVAAESLARRMSRRLFRERFLGLGGQGEPGATDQARRLTRGIASRAERSENLRDLRDLERMLGDLLRQGDLWFAALRAEPDHPPPGGRSRYRLGAGAGGPFPDDTFALVDAARSLVDRNGTFVARLRERLGDAADEGALSEIHRLQEAAKEAAATLEDLVAAGDSGRVYWMEDDADDATILHSRPLEMSATLGEALGGGRPLVLTSATLAADGSAAFFARQCGLPEGSAEILLPSVFPIERQVRALVPEMLREPTDPGHPEDLAEGIRRLAVAVPRKILVLFTSHETLRGVEQRIRGPLEDRGIWVYAQGRDASRSALAESFQEADRAVLLGAASFWEGVDFPGNRLEILVMVRLPFPVPTDPFVEATMERLRAEGEDPFSSYLVPEAVLRFRQGFGRLIRRAGDRGVFAILDPRILRRSYGDRFLRSIGVRAHRVDSWETLVGETDRWFRGESRATDEEETR